MNNKQLKAISKAIDKAVESFKFIEFSSRAEMLMKIDSFKIQEGKKYTILFEEVE